MRRAELNIKAYGFRLKEGNGKWMFWTDDDGHLTLHLGCNSGIVDVHKTDEDTEERRTIWAAGKEELIEWIRYGVLKQILIEDFLPLFKIVDREWLRKRNAWLITLDDLDFELFSSLSPEINDEEELGRTALRELLFLPEDLLANRLQASRDARYGVCLWRGGELEMSGLLFQQVASSGVVVHVYVSLDEISDAMAHAWERLKGEIWSLFTPEILNDLRRWTRS